MDKKISIAIMVLLVLSLIVNIVLLIMLKTRGEITGFATTSEVKSEEKPLLQSDVVEINNTELTKCCSFTNTQGKEDGCYVLRNYDCSYCSDYCK